MFDEVAGQEALLLLHKEVQPWHDRCASSFPALFIMSPAGVMPANRFIFQKGKGIGGRFRPLRGLWQIKQQCFTVLNACKLNHIVCLNRCAITLTQMFAVQTDGARDNMHINRSSGFE